MSTQPQSFSHMDADGNVRMVNVGQKPEQFRRAVAEGRIHCQPSTIALLHQQALPKGDVLTVAKIAAIQGAKNTSLLIPMCHSLPLTGVDVMFLVGESEIMIRAAVETVGRTGVEMEALAAVSLAALTIYDMCKAVDKTMRIDGIQVIEKTKA